MGRSEMASYIDEPWFTQIRRPSRYLGGEIHAVHKDPDAVELSLALAFPDIYEIGMSHLGLRILYHLLNRHSWLAVERVFCPWVDLEAELRARGRPLTTLESGRPLADFDIVGFSLQHELSYTNVLTMLDLGRIPLRAADRKNGEPLIMAGGPACFNPEPAAEFFDFFVIGDGEAAADRVCRLLRDVRPRRAPRAAVLEQLAKLEGVYVPSRFEVGYEADGTVAGIHPCGDQRPTITKALVADIDAHPFPTDQIVPYVELVHDRLAVEIARGCTRGCRFCQAGMIYRPVRERSPRSIFDKAREGLRSTGYEDLSLLSLSTGDYSCIEPLLERLMDSQSPNHVALSLPSLRVDSLSPVFLEQIKRVRKTGFTLAPEAGNERLRKVINKGLTQEDILRMAGAVYGAGWRLIKLYFMVGLPFEREEDVLDIIDLAVQVVNRAPRKTRKSSLNLSVAAFVPKAHTPFMWLPQLSLAESRRRIQLVREGAEKQGIRVKWNQPELSWLEGVFSRGDRRLARAVEAAWRRGARFDAWGEHFRIEAWQAAFEESGLDPDFYLYRERRLSEVLPWSHIRCGVDPAFLASELEKARTAEFTPDCRQGCLDCGVCDHEAVGPVLFDQEAPFEPRAPQRPEPPTGPLRKIRLTFSKLAKARFLSHLELRRLFDRAFRRAGLPLAYSRGFHPLPRFNFHSALPVGTASACETMDAVFTGEPQTAELPERLNRQLPPDIRVLSAQSLTSVKTPTQIVRSRYEVSRDGGGFDLGKVEAFLQADRFPVVKGGREREIRHRCPGTGSGHEHPPG